MAQHGANVAAVVPEKYARVVIENRPIPKPGPDELVVRNRAIAVNPVDWKIQDYAYLVNTWPNVLGSDVCGDVIAVGDKVTKFKEGDRVFGYAAVIYNSKPDHGAWQTYPVLRELSTTKLPDSTSYVEGSTFPMAYATALEGLVTHLGVDLKSPSDAQARESILLVWGAASSVGTAAIQVARNAGYTVWGTASKTHHGWVSKLGATKLFDYRDADVVDQIVAAAKAEGKPIKLAFDAVAEGNTFEQVPSVVKKSAGTGKIAFVLGFPEGKTPPEGLQIGYMMAAEHASKHPELGAWFFNEWLQEKLCRGDVVPAPPVEIIPGGVHSAQKLFDLSKAGVSGKKLVVEVA